LDTLIERKQVSCVQGKTTIFLTLHWHWCLNSSCFPGRKGFNFTVIVNAYKNVRCTDDELRSVQYTRACIERLETTMFSRHQGNSIAASYSSVSVLEVWLFLLWGSY
jgi:hypothetical protein